MPSAELSVVLVTNSFFPADKEGGPPFSNRELAQAMRRAGAQVSVISTDRNGLERLDVPMDRWHTVEGARVFYARTRPGTWLRSPTFGRAVSEAMRSADICIMSAVFWSFTGLSAWLACRRYRVPYVTYARGFLSPWALGQKSAKKSLYWRLIARRIVNGSATLIALAQQELEDYSRLGLAPPIAVIPNGAHVQDDSSINGSTAAVASTNLVFPAGGYFLFLGRIHAKKGIDLLLPAFERCISAGCNARLVIAGPIDRAYQQEFSRLLDLCSVRERVDVIGTVSGATKSSLIRGARAFVLSSYSEGLPVAVLEAMSMGIPVIITAPCNLPEVALERAGVVADLDAASIGDAMVCVWNDARLRQELSGNATRLARDKFSWDAVGARMTELCQRISNSERAHVA
jgi:glycosyltransferase involved in cell wall biosynthesis